MNWYRVSPENLHKNYVGIGRISDIVIIYIDIQLNFSHLVLLKWTECDGPKELRVIKHLCTDWIGRRGHTPGRV